MDDMRQEFLTYAHCGPPTSTRTTSLSQPRYVSAHTTTPVNQFSAVLMYRNCVHKRLPNRSPFAFRNSFTMLHQIPTSIRSGSTQSTLFDDECHQAAVKKNDAYQATLKSARAVYEKYREKRREERHLFRSKKH